MNKRLVQIGGAALSCGRPVICIPVMGEDMASLGAAARSAFEAGAEIIELRADSMHSMPTLERAQSMCETVRSHAPGIPLLFTLRTVRDGGAGDDDAAAYEALLSNLAQAGCAEAIDVEISVGWPTFERIASQLHAHGVALVGSSHDFSRTPPEEEMLSRLAAMEQHGADVCKIAVMPENRLDVLTLMRASVRADEALSAPVIAIAMGPLGVITRMSGEITGSCLTFGTAGKASAPGQMDAAQLKTVLGIIHNSI